MSATLVGVAEIMKPLINLDELEFESHEHSSFSMRRASIAEKIGAKNLGYNLTIVPPGKKSCPFHNHHVNEEMFFVIEGSGILRFGSQEYPLRKHDIIACPPGKRDVAHQIVNTGNVELKYLSLSTKQPAEIVEYPDSNKVSLTVRDGNDVVLRKIFKADRIVDYFEGE